MPGPGGVPHPAADPGPPGHGPGSADAAEMEGYLESVGRRALNLPPTSRTCCASWRRRSSARSRAGPATSTRPRTPCRRRCSPRPSTGRATAIPPNPRGWLLADRRPAHDRPAPSERSARGEREARSLAAPRRPRTVADQDDTLVAAVHVLPPGADAGLGDRADPARRRRPDHGRDRQGVPRPEATMAQRISPRQADHQGVRRAVPAARRRASGRAAAARCCTCST